MLAKNKTKDLESRLSHAEVLSLFDYDPVTGSLKWREDGRKHSAGDEVGCLNTGYRWVKIRRCKYGVHRLIWLYMTGAWPSQLIDHINRDRADNRWANLREAGRLENSRNRKRVKRGSSSGFVGVSKVGSKWRARVTVNGKNENVGRFETAEAAARARDAAALRVYGQFAIINFEAWQKA
jgi:hypothetical protein